MKEFTLDEKTEMSRAFDSGNYTNAYETTDLDVCGLDEMSEHERAAARHATVIMHHRLNTATLATRAPRR